MRLPTIAGLGLAMLLLAACGATPDDRARAATGAVELLSLGAELFCAKAPADRAAAAAELSAAEFIAGLATRCLESAAPVPVVQP